MTSLDTREELTVEQRDALIVLAREYRIPVATIARTLNISRARVYQILKAAK